MKIVFRVSGRGSKIPICHETTCDALHEIEEAVQVLDREDGQMVQDAKGDDFKRRERKQVLKDGYMAKAQELVVKNRGQRVVKKYALKHNMKQDDAKKLIPVS